MIRVSLGAAGAGRSLGFTLEAPDGNTEVWRVLGPLVAVGASRPLAESPAPIDVFSAELVTGGSSGFVPAMPYGSMSVRVDRQHTRQTWKRNWSRTRQAKVTRLAIIVARLSCPAAVPTFLLLLVAAVASIHSWDVVLLVGSQAELGAARVLPARIGAVSAIVKGLAGELAGAERVVETLVARLAA